jgi:hypothetical protein
MIRFRLGALEHLTTLFRTEQEASSACCLSFLRFRTAKALRGVGPEWVVRASVNDVAGESQLVGSQHNFRAFRWWIGARENQMRAYECCDCFTTISVLETDSSKSNDPMRLL